ncbi:pyruvate decarboxylase, alpha-keto-acid decarboxylase [Fructobacillus pseudoficulneus]|uniref:Alpha-keto-acid decarboxylase n=1 Tax=Fructobacillus pseudoficulneus TaxID=220714 RepID=A0A3F3GX43_9LACO|nr:thiamine pyrophosphate-binding protein [Fructobacillus pseudoficulneus]GAP03236.1 pyruvate decarboxylase, alpha-keto-acid decarboxylase [Fructobacillus pseudoficulneus]SEH42923.1 indolepyruvate decarboxylase [Fructobacillus pseudoficulneus]
MTEYTISDYLLDVIKALGADEILGVPGDYNLQFLDHITHRDDMKWVGNANELNASYMADGYAREKGFATFVTTFGVGELSAINGLAGSVAEHVPVLEIVGAPTNDVQNAGKLVHHTFGDSNFDRFIQAHEALGIKTTVLDAKHAIDQIDETLAYIHTTKQPAYLVLPSDLVNALVNPALQGGIANRIAAKQEQNVDQSVAAISAALADSKSPVIVVGHEVDRFSLGQAVKDFSLKNNIPVVDLGLGKGAVDESFANFVGTYNGTISDEEINQFVSGADTVLVLGAKLTDSVTGGFTQEFDDSQVINLFAAAGSIYGQSLPADYDFVATLQQLASTDLNLKLANVQAPAGDITALKATDKALTQAFYDRALQEFITADKTLVAEQGTSFFGLASQNLASGAKFFGQPLWGSIGYAFPATIGAQLANPSRRAVLSTGEGSLQLTIQDFGLALKERLTPVLFIIENTGYTVERVIHGMDEPYNDVPKYRYNKIAEAFGGQADQYDFIEVSTEQELMDAMQKADQESDKMVIIQANMAMKDAPAQLIETGIRFEAQNH